MSEEFDKFIYSIGRRVNENDKDSRIGFEEWNLLDIQDLAMVMESLIKKTLRAGFKLAEEEYECRAWFAHQYADGAEMSPGMIVVELPLGPTDGDGPQWQFSLYDMVQRMIDYYQQDDGTLEEGTAKFFEQSRDEMRELADIMDKVLKGEKYLEK